MPYFWVGSVCHVFCRNPLILTDFYAIRTPLVWHILRAYFLQIWGVGVVRIIFSLVCAQSFGGQSWRISHLIRPVSSVKIGCIAKKRVFLVEHAGGGPSAARFLSSFLRKTTRSSNRKTPPERSTRKPFFGYTSKAVRPVFAQVVGELRTADPSNAQRPVKQNGSPGGQSEAPRQGGSRSRSSTQGQKTRTVSTC